MDVETKDLKDTVRTSRLAYLLESRLQQENGVQTTAVPVVRVGGLLLLLVAKATHKPQQRATQQQQEQ